MEEKLGSKNGTQLPQKPNRQLPLLPWTVYRSAFTHCHYIWVCSYNNMWASIARQTKKCSVPKTEKKSEKYVLAKHSARTHRTHKRMIELMRWIHKNRTQLNRTQQSPSPCNAKGHQRSQRRRRRQRWIAQIFFCYASFSIFYCSSQLWCFRMYKKMRAKASASEWVNEWIFTVLA